MSNLLDTMMDSRVPINGLQSLVGKHNSAPQLNISANDLLASTRYSMLPHTRIL